MSNPKNCHKNIKNRKESYGRICYYCNYLQLFIFFLCREPDYTILADTLFMVIIFFSCIDVGKGFGATGPSNIYTKYLNIESSKIKICLGCS